ncbi:MAG: tripartite tricarboxylate transporter substrate-binding protein [Chloroflexota bacterium]
MRNRVGMGIALTVTGLIVAAACGGTGGGGAGGSSAAKTGASVALVSPTKPVEFIISTAPGGGSDIYARKMQSIIDALKLSPQPVTPVNKEGGSGAVAFQYVFDKKGDSSEIMITLNSFFTTLIVQKLPYKATDFTPIANLALDPFYLWVNEDSPWKNAQDFIAAAKADSLVVTGTGSKQEDEALFDRIQVTAGLKPFKYVPSASGSTVAAAVAGHQGGVVASVNNPSEGKGLYSGSPRKMRPLCTFEPASPTGGTFSGLATCTSQGLAISDYYIVRSIMAPPGLSAGQRAFWVDVFKKVYDSDDWKKFMVDNELKPDFRSGADFDKLIADYQKLHEDIAKQFNWIQ